MVITLMLTLAVSINASEKLQVEILDLPIPQELITLTPNLGSSGNQLFLSWLERNSDGHTLKVSYWNGDRFETPSSVYSSTQVFANWADFASVLPLGGNRLVAHWLEKAADGLYEYDIFVALSDDSGKTWGVPSKPHRDATLSEHGFVSMVRDGDEGFYIAWLDGREFKNPLTDREMTLRFTRFQQGVFGEEVVLDPRVCECCQTGMASTPSGLFVAYRDRSREEIRDISFVRLVNGGWSAPKSLNNDSWYLTGCPVNGPQVAADGDHIVAAWFTGSQEQPRVQVVFSDDGGLNFGQPIRVDGGSPIGRVDVEWLGDNAFVVWTENIRGRMAEVRIISVSRSGMLSDPLTISETGSSRVSGFPRMTTLGDELFVTWTKSYERNSASSVRVARISQKEALIDEPAANFFADSVDGVSYSLADLSDKVVLLNFWGTWCISCRDEVPRLVELDRKYRDEGLVVLGANYGDEPKNINDFVDAFGVTYPMLVDDNLAADYGILVYPTTIIIHHGRIRYRSVGYTRASFLSMSRVIERLLN